MIVFNTDEIVRLGLQITEDQKPKSGPVTVTVYDKANPGTPLLPTKSCVETPVSSGNYVYHWEHNITQRTHLRAVYTQGEYVFSEDILVGKNIITEIDMQDADGDGIAF